jgi:hypothetical protein
MIIKLDSVLFNELNNLNDLNYLITIFSNNRRYNYFCELGEIRNSELYKNLLPIHRELIEENYNSIVNQSLKPHYNVSNESSANSFNFQEAKIFFGQQVILILENNLNDSYFVDCILRNFRNKSKLLRKHRENFWLSYGNAGGCDNIINFITGLMKAYDQLPKENKDYLRCMVLLDSDKEYEDAATKPDRIKLFKFLIANNVPYHVLEKREMENYIPDEVLDSIPEIDEYIQAYNKLTPKQKDYFDLEKGFDGQNLKSFSPEVQALYNGVGAKDFAALRKGMSITKYEKGKKFKSEFPKLFESPNVTQENLLARVTHQHNPNELQTILESITNLL